MRVETQPDEFRSPARPHQALRGYRYHMPSNRISTWGVVRLFSERCSRKPTFRFGIFANFVQRSFSPSRAEHHARSREVSGGRYTERVHGWRAAHVDGPAY